MDEAHSSAPDGNRAVIKYADDVMLFLPSPHLLSDDLGKLCALLQPCSRTGGPVSALHTASTGEPLPHGSFPVKAAR